MIKTNMDQKIRKLIDDFINVSIQDGIAAELGDVKKSNKNIKKLESICVKLEKIGPAGIDGLKPLINHDNNYVRLHAATCLISYIPIESKRVLSELLNKSGLTSILSDQIVMIWKSGDLKIAKGVPYPE